MSFLGGLPADCRYDVKKNILELGVFVHGHAKCDAHKGAVYIQRLLFVFFKWELEARLLSGNVVYCSLLIEKFLISLCVRQLIKKCEMYLSHSVFHLVSVDWLAV